ncbi:hypothetical protein H8959_013853 [Pygathrix nigripes]
MWGHLLAAHPNPLSLRRQARGVLGSARVGRAGRPQPPVNPEGLLLPRAHPDGWSWAQLPSQQPSTGSLSGRSHNPSHNCVASDLPSWRQNSNLPGFSSGLLLTNQPTFLCHKGHQMRDHGHLAVGGQ